MLPQTVEILLTSEGRRYIVKNKIVRENGNMVVCFGEVERVSGLSVSHGADRRFLQDKVVISQEELTEDLLNDLWKQNRPSWEANMHRNYKRDLRKFWFSGMQFTDEARKRLQQIGYDIAADYLHGNYDPDEAESMLQDMATDAAVYNYELTMCGVPEEYGDITREIAADEIYEGMIRAKNERNDGP